MQKTNIYNKYYGALPDGCYYRSIQFEMLIITNVNDRQGTLVREISKSYITETIVIYLLYLFLSNKSLLYFKAILICKT